MIARCARLPSRPGLAGAAKDRSRCIRPVMHFYSAKPMHFYSGVDRRTESAFRREFTAVREEPRMPDEEIDEREQVLQYAARLQGLSLLRTGDTFALVEYKITGATLDEIAAFLTAHRSPVIEIRRVEEHRRADLRAMLKAERALLVEFEEKKRAAGDRNSDPEAIAAALAEIRRRITEMQKADEPDASSVTRRTQ